MLQLKLFLLACASRAFRSIALQVLVDFRVHFGLHFGSILELVLLHFWAPFLEALSGGILARLWGYRLQKGEPRGQAHVQSVHV